MNKTVNESRFYMWRAIFAMAHADGIVTAEESDFLNEYLSNVSFSEEQLNILKEDLKNPQDTSDMFSKITEQSDRAQFFYFALMLAWSDGDFDEQEKVILDNLRLSHIANLNLEQISKSVRESAGLVAADLNQKGVSMNFWENIRKFYQKEEKE